MSADAAKVSLPLETLTHRNFKPQINTFVLIRVSIDVLKHHDLKQFGKDRVYSIVQLSGYMPSLRRVRAGTQQELKQRPFRNTLTGLLLMSVHHGLVILFSYIIQECLCPQ